MINHIPLNMGVPVSPVITKIRVKGLTYVQKSYLQTARWLSKIKSLVYTEGYQIKSYKFSILLPKVKDNPSEYFD
ncbi:hypothetical protein BHU24_22145 [Bacillus pseudomycoides]|nr:hypothetical protein [Bacillus pseudomycoides]PDZ13434.1 hypothetical protein CON70_01560 [Bacillus pseudomycoides]PEO83573.1 hypothetical protein CN571_24770 [Bacillus pseudomycoides]